MISIRKRGNKMQRKLRKISTNIPSDLLSEATSSSGLNQTAAIIEGLKELIRKQKLRQLLALQGKINVNFDPERSRRRPRP